MAIIERFLDKAPFIALQNEFKTVINSVRRSQGELLLLIRPGNKINLYYQGNSIAAVKYSSSAKGWTTLIINRKFLNGISPLPLNTARKGIVNIRFKTGFDAADFIVSNLKIIKSNIRYVGFQPEITEEQAIVQDNWERNDLLLIDRQIADYAWTQKMDLLALKQIEGNNYGFCVIEVKLGNNQELDIRRSPNVFDQVHNYMHHISTSEFFTDYKDCYEKAYEQYLTLGLIGAANWHKSINIVDRISGVIFVARHLRTAYSLHNLAALQAKTAPLPDLKLQTADYRI